MFKSSKSVIISDVKDPDNYLNLLDHLNLLSDNDARLYKSYENEILLDQAMIDKKMTLKLPKIDQNVIILELEDVICKVTNAKYEDIEEFLVAEDPETNQICYYVYLREFALKFLEFISARFQVIIYTFLPKNITNLIVKTLQDCIRPLKNGNFRSKISNFYLI